MKTSYTLLAAVLVLAVCGTSFGQSRLSAPPDPSAVTVARLHYGGGGDWYWGNSALPNLMAFINKHTSISVRQGTPPTVELSSPELWNYPILFLTGHGNIRFGEQEVQILRNYLTAGGFLIANDSYGLDEAFRREMKRVFPDNPLTEIPFDYGLYRCLFTFSDGPPKVHEHDNRPARGYGIFVDGRLVCYYVHESDIGDGWEDPEVHGDSEATRRRALEMGANLVLWSLLQ
jgi:hypothetical protein